MIVTAKAASDRANRLGTPPVWLRRPEHHFSGLLPTAWRKQPGSAIAAGAR